MNKELRQALARGYCTKRNEEKIVDPDLIEDMITEINNLTTKEENCTH